ncbi:MAG: hypothetical protein HC800_06490 [Phormidesmis sp. RL_2_1]|nr:hypothetical protein [Phormidesmis sp. RL_2_1]
MAVSKCEISRCGLCRFYQHEGRRGGRCGQLDAPVDSHWKACCLASSPFSTATESVSEGVVGIAEWSVAKQLAGAAVATAKPMVVSA